jgi:hypothetical protein
LNRCFQKDAILIRTLHHCPIGSPFGDEKQIYAPGDISRFYSSIFPGEIKFFSPNFAERLDQTRIGSGFFNVSKFLNFCEYVPHFLFTGKWSRTNVRGRSSFVLLKGGFRVDLNRLLARLPDLAAILHFPENLGALFDLRSVRPCDSCFDHQQIDTHRIRHLVPEIAYQIAESTKKAFTCASYGGKRFCSVYKNSK